MSESENLSAALSRQVNIHGELHLDKVFTDLLLKWVASYERTIAGYEKWCVDVNAAVDEEAKRTRAKQNGVR